MLSYFCVHTFFIYVVHLSLSSVDHTCRQGSVIENIFICTALMLKQKIINTTMMHSNQGFLENKYLFVCGSSENLEGLPERKYNSHDCVILFYFNKFTETFTSTVAALGSADLVK